MPIEGPLMEPPVEDKIEHEYGDELTLVREKIGSLPTDIGGMRKLAQERGFKFIITNRNKDSQTFNFELVVPKEGSKERSVLVAVKGSGKGDPESAMAEDTMIESDSLKAVITTAFDEKADPEDDGFTKQATQQDHFDLSTDKFLWRRNILVYKDSDGTEEKEVIDHGAFSDIDKPFHVFNAYASGTFEEVWYDGNEPALRISTNPAEKFKSKAISSDIIRKLSAQNQFGFYKMGMKAVLTLNDKEVPNDVFNEELDKFLKYADKRKEGGLVVKE